MLTLQQLHYILLVSETRNFGKAARKAGVSQSAISQTIAAAEKKAGVSLFIRDKHGVTITEAGRLVADRAEAILNDVAEVGAQIEAQRTARSGRVRFGIAPIPASIVLVPALTQYVRRFPGVHPEFTVEFWETLLPKLLTGDISFFIAGRYAMLDDRRLTRRSLFREPLVIAARPGHPLAAGGAVEPSDLVRYPLVSHREPREIGDVIRRRLRDASELEMMRGNFPAALVHDLRPYFSIVERTNYLMLSARTTFRDMLAAGRFVEIPIRGIATEISIDIVARTRHRHSPAAAAMIDIIESIGAGLRP